MTKATSYKKYITIRQYANLIRVVHLSQDIIGFPWRFHNLCTKMISYMRMDNFLIMLERKLEHDTITNKQSLLKKLRDPKSNDLNPHTHSPNLLSACN